MEHTQIAQIEVKIHIKALKAHAFYVYRKLS